MAKPRPEKKSQPAPSSERRVLPMQLQIGDRLADETGEWEIIARPYTTAGGKTAHVRVQRVGQPDVTDLRAWGAHERISVRRATAEKQAMRMGRVVQAVFRVRLSSFQTSKHAT